MAALCVFVCLVVKVALVAGQPGDVHYVLKGGEATLSPALPKGPDDILWKHNGDKVITFDSAEERVFPPYEGRVTLGWFTAELSIADVRYEDSGEYELDAFIRNKLHRSQYMLKVLDKVSKPVIRCEMNGESANATLVSGATLHCSSDSSTPEALTFKWNLEGKSHLGQALAIALGNELDDVEYSCSASNPLQAESSIYTAKDCYTEGSPKALDIIVPVVIALLILLAFCLFPFIFRHQIKRAFLKCRQTADVEKQTGNLGGGGSSAGNIHRQETLLSTQPLIQQNDHIRPASTKQVSEQELEDIRLLGKAKKGARRFQNGGRQPDTDTDDENATILGGRAPQSSPDRNGGVDSEGETVLSSKDVGSAPHAGFGADPLSRAQCHRPPEPVNPEEMQEGRVDERTQREPSADGSLTSGREIRPTDMDQQEDGDGASVSQDSQPEDGGTDRPSSADSDLPVAQAPLQNSSSASVQEPAPEPDKLKEEETSPSKPADEDQHKEADGESMSPSIEAEKPVPDESLSSPGSGPTEPQTPAQSRPSASAQELSHSDELEDEETSPSKPEDEDPHEEEDRASPNTEAEPQSSLQNSSSTSAQELAPESNEMKEEEKPVNKDQHKEAASASPDAEAQKPVPDDQESSPGSGPTEPQTPAQSRPSASAQELSHSDELEDEETSPSKPEDGDPHEEEDRASPNTEAEPQSSLQNSSSTSAQELAPESNEMKEEEKPVNKDQHKEAASASPDAEAQKPVPDDQESSPGPGPTVGSASSQSDQNQNPNDEQTKPDPGPDVGRAKGQEDSDSGAVKELLEQDSTGEESEESKQTQAADSGRPEPERGEPETRGQPGSEEGSDVGHAADAPNTDAAGDSSDIHSKQEEAPPGPQQAGSENEPDESARPPASALRRRARNEESKDAGAENASAARVSEGD